MLDTAWTSADSIEFFTDSAGGKQRGFGIYFQGRWAQANWPNEWAENGTLADITFFGTFPSRSCYKYLGTSFEKQKTDIQY